MTDRNLTAGAKTQTEAAALIPVLFCELLFTTPVRAWTGLGPITIAMPGEASQTWDGLGDLGAIDAVGESADRRENGVRLSLSGVDPAHLADALTENYQGRSAKLWLAFLDSAHAVIADPVAIFGGMMDTMETADGEPTGAISIMCESRDVLTRRTSVSLLTDAEQQRLHPGDLGLAFVMELQSKQIIWGAPGGSDSPKTGGGGIPNVAGDFSRDRFRQ